MNPTLNTFRRLVFGSSQLRTAILVLLVLLVGFSSASAQILIAGTTFNPSPGNEGRYYIGIGDIVQYGLYPGLISITPPLAPNVNANIFNATPYYAITDNPIKLDSTRYNNLTIPDYQLIFSPSSASQTNLLTYAVQGLAQCH